MAKIDNWGTANGGQVLLANQYTVLNVNNCHLENTITAVLIKVFVISKKKKRKNWNTWFYSYDSNNVFVNVFCLKKMIFNNVYQKEVITKSMHI